MHEHTCHTCHPHGSNLVDRCQLEALYRKIEAKFATNRQVLNIISDLERLEASTSLQTTQVAQAAAAMVVKAIKDDMADLRQQCNRRNANIEVVPFTDQHGHPVVKTKVDYNKIYITPSEAAGTDEDPDNLWDEWIAIPVKSKGGCSCECYRWERLGGKRVDLSIIRNNIKALNAKLNDVCEKLGVSNTLFDCVAKYIYELRDELGAAADATDKTVYARLDQLEDWVNNGFSVDDEGGTVHYDGLLDRVKKLIAESFAGVEYTDAETVKANHKWEASFKNAAGEELAKIALDTKDFIIDGMLGDVKLISVVVPGTEIADTATGTTHVAAEDLEEPWKTLVAESATKEIGGRYLVFSFKTKDSDGHEDPENNYVGDQKLKNIWVSVKELHDNFVFTAEGNDYITLTVTNTHNTKDESAVVYSAALTTEAVELIDKCLGKTEGVRSYDKINTDLDSVIGWINEGGIIPVQFVKDYFDWAVFSGNKADDRAATLRAIDEAPNRGIDKVWTEGLEPTIEGYNS